MFAHVDLSIAVSCSTLEQDSASVSCVSRFPADFQSDSSPVSYLAMYSCPRSSVRSLGIILQLLWTYWHAVSLRGRKWHLGHHFLLPNWADTGCSREARKHKISVMYIVTCTHRLFLGNSVQLRQCLGSLFSLKSSAVFFAICLIFSAFVTSSKLSAHVTVLCNSAR